MDWRDGVDELLEGDYNLTAWEEEFLESMEEWDGEPTERQGEVLNRIFDQHGIDASV